jgi:SnoaL-like domain
MSETLDQLTARAAITQRLHLYCRGVDRRDPDLLTSSFWSDSKMEFGMFSGGGQEFAQSLCGWFEAGGVGLTSHMLGNVVIAVEGGIAFSECYLHAVHRLRRADGGEFDSAVGGRYQDRFERRDGVWRIAFRRLVFDWFREYPDTGDWTTGTMGVTAANAVLGAAGADKPWPEHEAALSRLAGD